MEKEKLSRQQIIDDYKKDVTELSRYLNWLMENAGTEVMSTYKGEIEKTSAQFPVYDSTLLSFVKEAQRTKLMDRNYAYAYSRYHMKTHEDEIRMIERAGIMEIDLLRGILSKYVLGGMTKGVLWAEAVHYRIFLNILSKMKELIEFWDKPMNG